MSEVRLNIIDHEGSINGTVHGATADAVVAALSAEPETIAELEAALERYIRPKEDQRPFSLFRARANYESWDAGIVVVDLAGRVVAVESTYSSPSREGEVCYHDGTAATDAGVLYRIPEDWLFVRSVDEYELIATKRRQGRAALPPLDAREVLYGEEMVQFIVGECLSARDAAIEDPISEIHARWLMTPRDHLRGQSPREVMLAKLDFIDFDLHTRQLQWSMLGEGPPPLAGDCFAYRHAGFGTHEYVLYYDLLRSMLGECWQRAKDGGIASEAGEVARLSELKTKWLEEPQPDLEGRVPASLIECERRRLPMAMSAKEMMIDEDCEWCQMLGEAEGPSFWHLDGSHMDNEFAFSFYSTRAEWEEEERQREEFNKEFNRKWAEREARIERGELVSDDGWVDE